MIAIGFFERDVDWLVGLYYLDRVLYFVNLLFYLSLCLLVPVRHVRDRQLVQLLKHISPFLNQILNHSFPVGSID